jgi:hypothetical protein
MLRWRRRSNFSIEAESAWQTSLIRGSVNVRKIFNSIMTVVVGADRGTEPGFGERIGLLEGVAMHPA